MGKTLAYKVLEDNCVEGSVVKGEAIAVKVHQTLTQDSTGTMVYLELDAMGIDEIKTDLSVAYIDHNTLQTGFENADDHDFIRSSAAKYGIVYSRPGNGICHQLHLERFAAPGTTLIGSDSHTPTAGGVGALAMGAGGMDVAYGMATGTYHMTVPGVIGVALTGSLPPMVSAKDVILKVLSELTVKGGVNHIVEYFGEGVAALSVTDRATICNMGAELGATTSLFPSDERTQAFLAAQGRPEDFRWLTADADAVYDRVLEIDLASLEPMVALPHSPDRVVAVTEVAGRKVHQVAIGSCTNASYRDLKAVSELLKGKTIHPDISLVIAPGSSHVLRMLMAEGAIADLIASGARLLEAACGPCIGMGQAPRSGALSVRTFNRNFKGRCGTDDAGVYLVSPETAAATALAGHLADARDLGSITVAEPSRYEADDSGFRFFEGDPEQPLVMGPNIKPFPKKGALETRLAGEVLLKTGDNITTDDIMPSNAALLPFRSNIPALSEHAFGTLVKDFKKRAEKAGGGIVIGGENYGQGSSREHAALVPLYLGVRAVVAKSFARIHRQNLINAGILPLVFDEPSDYDRLVEGKVLTVEHVHGGLEQGIMEAEVKGDKPVALRFGGSERERRMLLAGGLLNLGGEGI